MAGQPLNICTKCKRSNIKTFMIYCIIYSHLVYMSYLVKPESSEAKLKRFQAQTKLTWITD